MYARALVTLSVALLSASAEKVAVQKCCDAFEMFAADGWNCEPAPWARNLSLLAWQGDVVAPHRQRWLDAWLPPGLPVQALGGNLTAQPRKKGLSLALVRSVNETVLWSARDPNRTYGPNVLLLEGRFAWRPRPLGGFRKAHYCVDNAPPPQGPYLMRLDLVSSEEKMVFKCCFMSHLLAANASGNLYCASDARGQWAPAASPALSLFDPEAPFALRVSDPAARFLTAPLPRDGAAFARALLRPRLFDTFYSTAWGPCADFLRDEHGALHEVMAYLHTMRPARAAYWVTRHLSWAAVAALAAALAAVGANPRMRATVHGRALACHAACLLLFNALQLAYALTASRQVDAGARVDKEPLATRCLAFGFTAYFLQTAAGWWLTAVCINMGHGFRMAPRRGRCLRRERRLFLWLSALAWGAATVLTALCVAVVVGVAHRGDALPWFRPSLMETRTCYSEIKKRETGDSVKWGTLLYFYGPMCALVLFNVGALGKTAFRVHHLRRGNSMLRREDSDGPEESAKPTGIDPQSVIVYLKLLLSAGGLEMMIETCAWALTKYEQPEGFQSIYLTSKAYFLDHTFAYRSAGYCADLLRALLVLWLCAPDRAALRALGRRLRGRERST